eukprot:SAG31_NODE_2437_length_5696_cov_2.259067_4_plen_110_part_00
MLSDASDRIRRRFASGSVPDTSRAKASGSEVDLVFSGIVLTNLDCCDPVARKGLTSSVTSLLDIGDGVNGVKGGREKGSPVTALTAVGDFRVVAGRFSTRAISARFLCS